MKEKNKISITFMLICFLMSLLCLILYIHYANGNNQLEIEEAVTLISFLAFWDFFLFLQ